MDVAEIRLCVGDLLQIHDLVSCVRVSSLWYETYIPLLYRTAHDPTYQNYWSSFERHIHYAYDLRIPFNSNPLHLEKMVMSCKNLKQLTVRLTLAGREVPFILSLVKENPQLIGFELEKNNQQKTTSKLILDAAVEHCPRISSLKLVSQELSGALLNRVLTMSSRLTKLELLYCRIQPQEEPWVNWPEFPQLKELKVANSSTTLVPHKQLKLFHKCPKLETISWNTTHTLGDALPVSKFVSVFGALLLRGDNSQGNISDGCWPRLHSICLQDNRRASSLSDVGLAGLLKSCPNGLRRLEFPLATCEGYSMRALKRHWESLQVLHLNIDGAAIHEILSSCPRLVEFYGATLRASDLVERSGTHVNGDSLSPLTTRPWVCLNLEVLRIAIKMEFDHPAEKMLFQQLCGLKRLKELHLCGNRPSPVYGLDLRTYFGFDVRSRKISGEYHNARTIMSEPIGRRLLKIWPELTNCKFYYVYEEIIKIR